MSKFHNRQSVGLALGGGAARGWAHIGVLQAFAERDITITHIAGTSIGAFVGAFYATGRLDLLLENVLKLNWKKELGYLASIPSKTGILNGRRIGSFLEEHLGVENVEETSIPFCAVAADLRTGKAVVLGQGGLSEAVRASISVPGIFTPVQKGKYLLVDGGLLDPVPVGTVRNMGAEQVIAVDLNAVSGSPDHPLLAQGTRPNMLEVIGASANIIEAKLTQSILAADPPELLIQPGLAQISYLDFNRGEEMVQLGYDAAMGSLDGLNHE